MRPFGTVPLFLFSVVVAHHISAFHYESYVFQLLDVVERALVYSYQVGIFVGLDGSDLVGPTHQVGSIDSC